MSYKKILSVIIPVYNEEKNLKNFIIYLRKTLYKAQYFKKLFYKFEIIIINDGSNDKTPQILYKLRKEDKRIKFLNFSKNFGKEAALTAGIDFCKGDAAVPIDVDFQDDPTIINNLIKKYGEGYDVVLAKRKYRNDNFIKIIFANCFYFLFNLLSNQKIPKNVGDFRLISKKVIDVIKLYREKNRFMKGIFASVGFKTTEVLFHRKIRPIDKPKQSFKKLILLALDAIINFSTTPLKFIFVLGVLISSSSFLFGLYILIKKIFLNINTPGFTTIMCIITLLGGVQILSLGVIGMYISKMYLEIKNRPIYIISEAKGF